MSVAVQSLDLSPDLSPALTCGFRLKRLPFKEFSVGRHKGDQFHGGGPGHRNPIRATRPASSGSVPWTVRRPLRSPVLPSLAVGDLCRRSSNVYRQVQPPVSLHLQCCAVIVRDARRSSRGQSWRPHVRPTERTAGVSWPGRPCGVPTRSPARRTLLGK